MRALTSVVVVLVVGLIGDVGASPPFRRPCPPAGETAIGPFWHVEMRIDGFESLKIDLPGGGVKVVSYLRYRLTNPGDQPRRVSPLIALVQGDRTIEDEVLPVVEEGLRQRDDPEGKIRLFNSVSLATASIGPGETVHAIALWKDVEMGSAIKVQVRGLSNGFYAPGTATYYKMLRLSVRRDAEASAEWVYTATR